MTADPLQQQLAEAARGRIYCPRTRAIITGGLERPWDVIGPQNPLEQDIYEIYERIMPRNRVAASALWRALVGRWWCRDGRCFGYTYRAAGDLIARLHGAGSTYLDWYLLPAVDDHVNMALIARLGAHGWQTEVVDVRV